MATSPGTEANSDAAAGQVAVLIYQHLGDLIAYCRREILARPQLRAVAAQFNVADSDDWLRQAVSVFLLFTKGWGPAVEWHDEVGALTFSAGVSVADASDCLAALRDGILELVWKAAGSGELPAASVPGIVRLVLGAFDHAVGVQASAYVRESQRHLNEVNRALEFRQEMLDRDLGLARLVQQQFIPREFASKHFRAAVRYIPTAGIGGDHAGIFPVSDERLYVTISDVTGHGVASALVAEIVNSRLGSLLRQPMDTAFQYPVEPSQVVRDLNALFYNEFQHLGVLLSFFIALFEVTEGTITYSGAGHPPPLLLRSGQAEPITLVSQNIILGAEEDCLIGEGHDVVPVNRGDRVIFYTDGIIEAGEGKQMFGLDGLCRVLREHHGSEQSALADEILKAVHLVAAGNELDDMSLLVVDVTE